MTRLCLIISIIILKVCAFGQFDEYIKKSQEYKATGLYDKSRVELKKAIALAEKKGNEKQIISAKINLVELYRQTGDCDKAFEAIRLIENVNKYPRLEANYLGRMAALYHECYGKLDLVDSVSKYASKALKIAQEQNMTLDIAVLNNELGFLKFRHQKSNQEVLESLDHYIVAAKIFEKDSTQLQNYLNTLNHILEIKIFIKDWTGTDSIQEKLDSIYLKNPDGLFWQKYRSYDFYSLEAVTKGDTCTQFKWQVQYLQALRGHEATITAKDMLAFRVKYETDNVKADLDKISERFYFILIAGSVIILLLFGALYLFIKERKQKRKKEKLIQQLNELNKNYELLMKESNHRIKNNLLMIVSFLQITGLKASKEEQKLLGKIQSKIEAISALHKLLRFENHNELVSVRKYIFEVISYFKSIDKNDMIFDVEVDDVTIPSEDLIYLGLILTELILNTIEHRKNNTDSIKVQIKKSKEINFYYSDSSSYTSTNENMGMSLLREMVSRINGKNLVIDKAQGIIKFNIYGRS